MTIKHPSQVKKTTRNNAYLTILLQDIHGGKGGISALYINHSTPIPTPVSSQALVKIRCFGLNRMDLLQREGLYPVPPQAPSTLGVEFSGTIESLPETWSAGSRLGNSEPESDFQVGDEVFGLAYGGAYAEYIAVSTHMLIRKPAELSWEQAAGIPEVWITAMQAMYLIGEYAPGKSMLWHAGASAVSIAGIQLAMSEGEGEGEIFVTASSQEKIEFCRRLGATQGFNYKTQDWSQEVLRATGARGDRKSVV